MADVPHARNNIGRALQRLRRSSDLTLSAVSSKTGVAVSTLSKIENNRSSPNFDVLTRLADGLGLDLITLLGDSFYTFAPGARTVNRAGEGVFYETPLGRYEALSGEIAMKALQPSIIQVPTGRREPAAMSSHGGEEFLYVLRGTVRFHMDPYSPTTLDAGDSVHFNSLMPHAVVAVGDEDAWVLAVSIFDRGTGTDSDGGSAGAPEADAGDTG